MHAHESPQHRLTGTRTHVYTLLSHTRTHMAHALAQYIGTQATRRMSEAGATSITWSARCCWSGHSQSFDLFRLRCCGQGAGSLWPTDLFSATSVWPLVWGRLLRPWDGKRVESHHASSALPWKPRAKLLKPLGPIGQGAGQGPHLAAPARGHDPPLLWGHGWPGDLPLPAHTCVAAPACASAMWAVAAVRQ